MKKTQTSLKKRLISAALVLVMLISSLVGTTFAWFTDSVTSTGNKIISGSLKVDLELLDKKTGNWNSLKETRAPIFTYDNWEPGYIDAKLLRIENEGTLALKWKAQFVSEKELSKLAEVIDVYVRAYGVLKEDSTVSYPADRSLKGYTKVGTVAEFVNTIEQTTCGNLLAGEVAYLGIALKMQETAGNEYQNLDLGGAFDIRIVATQMAYEGDSFGLDYDKDASFPGEFKASAPVSVTAGAVSEETTIGEEEGIHAKIPAGVKVADGATDLTLSIKTIKESEANVTLNKGEVSESLDIHMDGVAEDNTTPMLITLEGLFSKGLNATSVKMYHVENGVTVEMTMVANPVNHNEFSYDPATGNVVMAVASFSEYVTVEDNWNLWEGGFDTAWYNDTDTTFTLSSADQLAGFGAIVDGGYKKADGTVVELTADTFEGKTVKLGNDIDLAGGVSFNPIGAHYPGHENARNFKGTFDGQGYTIKNLYQNGWEMGLSYSNAGAGLFAGVQNATIKNLTMSGADIVMEAVPMGTVAAYAYGACTFDNIRVTGSTLQNYNWDIAAVVGGVNGQHTFSNIYVDNTVTLSSLWGSFGGGIGGVIGSVYGGHNGRNKVTMNNVTVACVMDVYNDVTSAYQWYAYRFCGMLIGNTNEPGADGKNAYTAQASYLTCKDVNVYYGDWVNYHYCQFTNQSNETGSVDWQNNYPWVRVEAGLSNPGYSNVRYGHPIVDGVAISDANHTHDTHEGDDQCNVLLTFNQLYGGDQGVYGQFEHEGVEVTNYRYSITYVNDDQVLAIKYVTEDGAVETKNGTAQELVEKWASANITGTWAFGGWMNAGSTKLTKIDADNTKDIVLYPYFNKPYTARFVDQQGNVVAWCFFHAEDLTKLDAAKAAAEAALPDPGESFKFDYWEVHITDNNGEVTSKETYNKGSFAGYTKDVTIYPVYKFEGDVKLIPFDTDSDGIIDYYQVAGYSNPDGQALVEIPGSVNGIPIAEISGGAFSSYDGVHSITIPADITYIGDNAFAEKWGTFDSGETITIYYAGSHADWIAKEPKFASNWESGISSSTRIFFLNGGDTVDVSQGYLQAKVSNSRKVTWTLTTITQDIIKEYTSHCDCSISTTGDNAHIYVDANGNVMNHNDAGTPVNANGKEIYFQDGGWFGSDKLTDGTNTYYRYRPDAAYWEGVTPNG